MGVETVAKQSMFPKDFAKQLEKDIKRSIEQDVKKHPKKFLDNLIGEPISEKCKKCGYPKMTIVKGGEAKCTECGYTEQVSVNVSWR